MLTCDFGLLQNTYTNAEKLLTAAEELAQTGECNADEIYSVAHELESHVTSFAARVDQRRRRLDLAVHFYTQEKEVREALLANSFISYFRQQNIIDTFLRSLSDCWLCPFPFEAGDDKTTLLTFKCVVSKNKRITKRLN